MAYVGARACLTFMCVCMCMCVCINVATHAYFIGKIFKDTHFNRNYNILQITTVCTGILQLLSDANKITRKYDKYT